VLTTPDYPGTDCLATQTGQEMKETVQRPLRLARQLKLIPQYSDEVVAEPSRLGRPVRYMVFGNERHQIRRWRNRLSMWRSIEDFLAECLGGRSGGFDYYRLMPHY
jgi:hypothetical protein